MKFSDRRWDTEIRTRPIYSRRYQWTTWAPSIWLLVTRQDNHRLKKYYNNRRGSTLPARTLIPYCMYSFPSTRRSWAYERFCTLKYQRQIGLLRPITFAYRNMWNNHYPIAASARDYVMYNWFVYVIKHKRRSFRSPLCFNRETATYRKCGSRDQNETPPESGVSRDWSKTENIFFSFRSGHIISIWLISVQLPAPGIIHPCLPSQFSFNQEQCWVGLLLRVGKVWREVWSWKFDELTANRPYMASRRPSFGFFLSEYESHPSDNSWAI